MNKLDITDKTLKIYSGENQDTLTQSILIKEIKGFKIDKIDKFITTMTLFIQWGDITVTVTHEQANELINRLSDILEDNKVEVPELTGDTIIIKINRYLSSAESKELSSQYEEALNKKVILFDKSIEILGSVSNKEEEPDEEDNPVIKSGDN